MSKQKKLKPSERVLAKSKQQQKSLPKDSTQSKKEVVPASFQAANTSVPKSDSLVSDFSKTIAESKEALATSTEPKRGRGRPKKLNDGGGASDTKKDETVSTSAVAPLAVVIPAAALVPVLKFPFGIVAKRTKFSGFEMSDDEAKEFAPLLDQVLKTYMPQVESKHAAAISLGIGLAVSVGCKYMAYSEWLAQKEKENAQN